MTYYSTHFDDFLWYLILRENKKKIKSTPKLKAPPHFQCSGRNNWYMSKSFRTVPPNKLPSRAD